MLTHDEQKVDAYLLLRKNERAASPVSIHGTEYTLSSESRAMLPGHSLE